MPPSRARRYMGQSVTSMPFEHDLAGVGLDHAAGHAEAGRLAGAVGAQQPDDLALFDVEIDAVDDAARPRRSSPVRGRSSIGIAAVLPDLDAGRAAGESLPHETHPAEIGKEREPNARCTGCESSECGQ